MTDVPISSVGVGSALWVAPNPFGEPTAYLLVHPRSDAAAPPLGAVAGTLGLKRIDEPGDILPVGTDVMVAALRGLHVDLWAGDRRWLELPVGDSWTAAAVGRRYIVLVIGSEPQDEVADADQIAAYLGEPGRVRTGLVKIRLKVTDQ